MKANTQYTDLFGSVAADISDFTTRMNQLDELANYFKIDQKRFKVIGITVNGIKDFFVSFICVDKEKSTAQKKHITKIHIEGKENILAYLFKRLEIVLYEDSQSEDAQLGYNEEISINNL